MHNPDDIQIVVFRVGSQELALDILQVERILRYAAPAALPRTPDFLEGVVGYSGGTVPVIDLRKRFEVESVLREETRMMVIDVDGQRVALVVDEVREVRSVDSTTIGTPPPIVRGLTAPYLTGIINLGERLIVMLNARRLLTSTERIALEAVAGAAGANA